MFAKLLIAPLLIATSVVAAPSISRRDVSLSDWQSQGLESYWKFKMRFRSLDCASQTGTDFYTNCCYPLGATGSLSDRPAECTPTTCAAPSISTAEPTAPTPSASVYDDEEDLPYCDETDDWYDETGDYSSVDGNDIPTDHYEVPTPIYYEPAPSQEDPQPTTTQAQENPPSGGSGDTQYGGFATFYFQNGNPGSCGDYRGDYELIAAIHVDRYGWTGQRSALCGQRVRITNTNNGHQVDVVIADACPSCVNSNSIDLSVGAFEALAPQSDGMVPIEWTFI